MYAWLAHIFVEKITKFELITKMFVDEVVHFPLLQFV